MNPRVVSVTPQEGFQLRLVFSSGEVGCYDCRHLLDFGVFRELKDWDIFAAARVEMGTVTWPGGQDICPDTLYLDSKKTPAGPVEC